MELGYRVRARNGYRRAVDLGIAWLRCNDGLWINIGGVDVKNNRWNRFTYNLGLDYFGPSKWGWFIIPNFIWNSGLVRKFPELYQLAKRIFTRER